MCLKVRPVLNLQDFYITAFISLLRKNYPAGLALVSPRKVPKNSTMRVILVRMNLDVMPSMWKVETSIDVFSLFS